MRVTSSHGWILRATAILSLGLCSFQRTYAISPGISGITSICDGAHDLIVDGTFRPPSGRLTLDRLCISGTGRLYFTDALEIRAGYLLIAKGGRLNGDGRNGNTEFGGPSYNDACEVIDTHPNGTAGGHLTLRVRHAVIAGTVSVDGGRGQDYGGPCLQQQAGQGGAGGILRIIGDDLQLSGTLSARGGRGGNGQPADQTAKPFRVDGGDGGQISVNVPGATASQFSAHSDVNGGVAGHGGSNSAPASMGRHGLISGGGLSAVLAETVPPEPSLVIRTLPGAPQMRRDSGAQTTSRLYRCMVSGLNLIVPSHHIVTLSGLRVYRHVCIQSGGTLRVVKSLSIRAMSVVIAHGGKIVADGAGPAPTGRASTGFYNAQGACVASREFPHGGVNGTVSGVTSDAYATTSPQPGGGGGLLTISASYIAIDGTISARGSRPLAGFSDAGHYSYYTGGAGAGSGGGIYISAQTVRIGGQIDALGGDDLPIEHLSSLPITDVTDPASLGGIHGGPGCIKVFTASLSTGTSSPFLGPTVLGPLRISESR